MTNGTQVDPKVQSLINNYQGNRVNVQSAVTELKGKVRGLITPSFSDFDRQSLEDVLDRLEIEKDPALQAQGLLGYEQTIRDRYIASLGIIMRNGQYGDKADRRAMKEAATEMFYRLNDYKREER